MSAVLLEGDALLPDEARQGEGVELASEAPVLIHLPRAAESRSHMEVNV